VALVRRSLEPLLRRLPRGWPVRGALRPTESDGALCGGRSSYWRC
jgi:hypothetical protein